MSPSTLTALQELHRLNRTSFEFQDGLRNLLYGEAYRECAQNLKSGDVVWLVDYLDKVCCHITPLPTSYSSHYSLSTVSTIPVQLSGSVSANSRTYVAPGGSSQHRTRFGLAILQSLPSRSPQEVMVMCTRGPMRVLGFASNVCACTLATTQRRQLKCALAPLLFPFVISNGTHRPSAKRP